MPGTILDEVDQPLTSADTIIRSEFVHQDTYRSDDLKVCLLVVSADVIALADTALLSNEYQGTGVVLDVQPVPDILPFAIDRQWPPLKGIQNHERDQLFGEVIRPVVVRA